MYPGSRFPICIGAQFGASTTATATQALNAAGTWLALGFQATSRTLNEVRAFLSATAGTLIAGDVTATLYSDVNGAPGAAIDGPFNCATTPSGSAWYNWTGFTTALTGGSQYWIVFKNLNGTPGTNFPTFRIVTSLGGFSLAGTATHGDARKTSTDSGSTWAGTSNSSIAGFRLAFADGTYGGSPLSNFTNTTVGAGVYGTREVGSMFTSPGVDVNAAGLYMMFDLKTGTPTGNARFRLYTGSTPSLVATTEAVPNAALVTGPVKVWAPFSAVQTIPANTVCRVVAGETAQGDASTNRFNFEVATVDTDAPSLALMPQGGMVQTYFDGSVWTETSSALIVCGMYLDPDNEFDLGAPVVSGGGSPFRGPF